jgi:hypothetical protein
MFFFLFCRDDFLVERTRCVQGKMRAPQNGERGEEQEEERSPTV